MQIKKEYKKVIKNLMRFNKKANPIVIELFIRKERKAFLLLLSHNLILLFQKISE